MSPGLNPQNVPSFRDSPFRRIGIIIGLSMFLFDFVLSLGGNPKFDACQPKNCGTGPNISYPFWILGVQQPYCGFPGFEIECYNQRPIYETSRSSYVIEEISYEENLFRVVNQVVLDAGCPLPSLNYSFDRLPVTFGPGQVDLCIFRNCDESFSVNSTISRVECAPGEGNNSFAAIASMCDYLNWNRESCQCLVAAPVQIQNWKVNQSVDYLKLLEDGFTLNWIGYDCMRCRRSGGRCGSENSTSVCYCRDGTHLGYCGDGNNYAALKIGVGSGVGALASIFLCSCIYMIHYKRRHPFLKLRSRQASSGSSLKADIEVGNVLFEVPIFTNGELEEATNYFDSARELGDGGYGTVYHGKLRDGREVAVKRLYEHNYRRVKQFMTEVQILTRLRHKYLVSLYGCTSQHSRELLLVYEYIPNGTVADHLHGKRAQQDPLLWPTRISIAIETATALAYLHASDIIHRDVKTNNILLDNNFSVKVADFGLSRLFPNDVSHVSTAPQGTPGYVDPEYHQCYQLTEKSDVYSFGVVLVELISSMPAVDISRDRHEINLANLATSKIQKHAFHELIDPNLGFESDPEINRMIMAVAELAFRCLQQDKDMRPSMETVLEELKAISSGTQEPDKSKDVSDDNSIGQSKNPPPSPESEGAGLLKNVKPSASPVSVTQKWGSSGSSTVQSG